MPTGASVVDAAASSTLVKEEARTASAQRVEAATSAPATATVSSLPAGEAVGEVVRLASAYLQRCRDNGRSAVLACRRLVTKILYLACSVSVATECLALGSSGARLALTAAMEHPKPVTYEVMGIADTGAGRHITSKAAFVDQGVPVSRIDENMTTASGSVTFNTGGGSQHCRNSTGMTSDVLRKTEVHVLEKFPMVWSTGQSWRSCRCLLLGARCSCLSIL